MKKEFIHLHLHTKYSILDGMCRIEEIIKSARNYNMPAAAITDHGNMHGAVEFYSALAKAGIKPIIGMEIYIVDDIKHNIKNKIREKNHLVLLAKNEAGYKNLIKIASFAATEGMYYKPTADKTFLKNHAEGLIGMSACVQGEVPSKIIAGDMDGAKNAALYYLRVFGENNFYFEMQNHGIEDELIMNRGLKSLSKELSIPLTVSNDTHYMKKDDSSAHESLLCVQTGQTLKSSSRMHFTTNEFYFKSYNEMEKAFPDESEAIEKTVEIANKCDFTLELIKNILCLLMK